MAFTQHDFLENTNAMTSQATSLMTDELPLRIEAAELAGGEQFTIENQAEIDLLLQQLGARRSLACLYVDETEAFALSRVLGTEQGRLFLELPTGDLRTTVLGGAPVLCVSSLQRVKLQFDIGTCKHADWQGIAACSFAYPKQILRFQRRDFYRLTVPLGHPLSCHIPGNQGDEVEVSLVDISIGGIGILGYAPGVRLSSGLRYQNVRIELPETGTIAASIEIRASFDVTLKNGIRTVRTGAQFVGLPGTAQALIQRYITKVERARIALQQGTAAAS